MSAEAERRMPSCRLGGILSVIYPALAFGSCPITARRLCAERRVIVAETTTHHRLSVYDRRALVLVIETTRASLRKAVDALEHADELRAERALSSSIDHLLSAVDRIRGGRSDG